MPVRLVHTKLLRHFRHRQAKLEQTKRPSHVPNPFGLSLSKAEHLVVVLQSFPPELAPFTRTQSVRRLPEPELSKAEHLVVVLLGSGVPHTLTHAMDRLWYALITRADGTAKDGIAAVKDARALTQA